MFPPKEPWKACAADAGDAAGGACLASLAATTPFTTLTADGGSASDFCAFCTGAGAVRAGTGFSASSLGGAAFRSSRLGLFDAIVAGAECCWYFKIPSDAMTRIPAATNPQRRAGQVIQVLRVGRIAVSSVSVAGKARATTSRQSPQRAK